MSYDTGNTSEKEDVIGYTDEDEKASEETADGFEEDEKLEDDRTPDEIHEDLSGETKLLTNQGLTADEYCVSDPWINSSRLSEDEEAELSGIEVEYDLKKEEVVPGLRAFQKKVSRKKNIIYTAILAVLAGLYLDAVIKDPSYAAGYILMALSIVVIFMIWYLPVRHINSTVKAIESEKMKFKLEFSEFGILIPENGSKYLVRYSTPAVSVIELSNAFTVCVSREKVFIIPKRCIAPEVIDKIRQNMKAGLGERYTEQT